MTDVSSDNVCVDCGEGKNATSLSSATTYKAYDPLDESTFEPPPILPVPTVTIEFCDRVCYLHLIVSFVLLAFNSADGMFVLGKACYMMYKMSLQGYIELLGSRQSCFSHFLLLY